MHTYTLRPEKPQGSSFNSLYRWAGHTPHSRRPQPQTNGLQSQEGRDLRKQLGDSGAASTVLVLGVGQALPDWVAASQGPTSVLFQSLPYSTHSAAFQTLLSTQSPGLGSLATFPDPLPPDLRRKQSRMERPQELHQACEAGTLEP